MPCEIDVRNRSPLLRVHTHVCPTNQIVSTQLQVGLPRTLFIGLGEFAKMWCWSADRKSCPPKEASLRTYLTLELSRLNVQPNLVRVNRSTKLEWFSYFNLLVLNCIKLYRIKCDYDVFNWSKIVIAKIVIKKNIDIKIVKFECIQSNLYLYIWLTKIRVLLFQSVCINYKLLVVWKFAFKKKRCMIQ